MRKSNIRGHRLTNPVHRIAVRLRFWVNLKGLVVGGKVTGRVSLLFIIPFKGIGSSCRNGRILIE